MIKISPKHIGSTKWWEIKDAKNSGVVGYIQQGKDGMFRFEALNDAVYDEKILISIANTLKRLNKLGNEATKETNPA